MSPDVVQLPLFDLGPYEEPDTSKAEYWRARRAELARTWVRRHNADPPPVAGRPWQDVVVSGGRL
jgi:hypothetical protein